LIFTIVTVIFLPLSFVTGYLGMNVEDIRNVRNKQGIFWIIALPITGSIFVAITVLLVPALRRRVEWVFGKWRAKTE
jgi:Mg2+ and Co2+ transporter CorA